MVMLLRAGPRALRLGASRVHPVPRAVFARAFAQHRSPGPGTAASQATTARLARDSIPNAKKSEPADYSNLQDELQTPADPAQNTAPRASPTESPETATGESAAGSIPLHDLTKGIPSTLDAELEAARKSHDAEDAAAAQASGGGRGDRKMPSSAYETSAERRKNKIFGYVLIAMATGAVGGAAYLGRNWANEDEERQHASAPSGWGPMLFYRRLQARLSSTMDYYNEPAFPKLLPDPDPAWERPYTLVVSLEDMLVHSEWTREHGWRLAKRPGVDYFLRYLSQYYEIVIFTSLPSMFAEPIIRKLDPFQIAMWPLFREATRYSQGKYIKDLSYLNRDLNKIIMVDTDATHASMQPDNAIILPKWKGTPNDKDLVSLIPFLEYVAGLGFRDTRTVLASYKDADSIPAEFARREAQMREKFNHQLAEQRQKRPRQSGMGFVGKALGIKQGQGMIPMPEMEGIPTLSEGFEQGMMLHDQIRLRGQRQYALLEKEIRENGEKWLKEMAVGEERAKEEAMKGMKTSFAGWFSNRPSEEK